jgi:hypothetical protein
VPARARTGATPRIRSALDSAEAQGCNRFDPLGTDMSNAMPSRNTTDLPATHDRDIFEEGP